MSDVNTAIGLTRGKISQKFSTQQEKIKLKKKEKSSSVQLKKEPYSWKKAEGITVVTNSKEKEEHKVLLAWKY